MKSNFFVDINSFLPLEVIAVNWKSPIIEFSGVNWRFKAACSWYIMDSQKFLVGSDDETAADFLCELIGSFILEIIPQSSNLPLDPKFLFSNNQKINFFSVKLNDTWFYEYGNSYKFIGPVSNSKNHMNENKND